MQSSFSDLEYAAKKKVTRRGPVSGQRQDSRLDNTAIGHLPRNRTSLLKPSAATMGTIAPKPLAPRHARILPELRQSLVNNALCGSRSADSIPKTV